MAEKPNTQTEATTITPINRDNEGNECADRFTERKLTCEHGFGGGFCQVQGGLAISVADVRVCSMLQ